MFSLCTHHPAKRDSIVFDLRGAWIRIRGLGISILARIRTFMTVFRSSVTILTFAAVLCAGAQAHAAGLVPHKALYSIDLIATHNGSQITNIGGKMLYETRQDCEAWITDHHFDLFYEYAESPGMRITSDFSTYESNDGKKLNFTSRRSRDGEMYQEIRGSAETGAKLSQVTYTMPDGLKQTLTQDTVFPTAHTMELIRSAQKGDKFYTANVFDGSDEEGPIEINSFIGKQVEPQAKPVKDKAGKIDTALTDNKAWNVRMAVFPSADKSEESDYEMSMVFHENGVISDMVIDYDDFTVRQKLIALEKLPAASCGNPPQKGTKAP
ncbi:MAG: DUF1849 domain-containing protein [Micavibrio aeruginosavorus]|uniref:DUF1849 domain-containing protein n=1 Tax=Micavibrio aeruginosavorus TaxID=349221 RepID=A0A2W5A0F8_9BACT|nr:MAG: DUF1849 domain-containing protein [Micavibrio aeruginosavorus]